jgi:hypothetical protein
MIQINLRLRARREARFQDSAARAGKELFTMATVRGAGEIARQRTLHGSGSIVQVRAGNSG